MMNLQKFAEIAETAADAAGATIRKHFHQPLDAERKNASSPIVTIADREAESVMRQKLHAALPDHAIYGEEEGYQAGSSPYEWILDPIDGTIAFSCGKPVFASLISLCHAGEPVLGIIDQPIVGHRWIGLKGHPTRFNGTPCRTSRLTDLSQSRFSTTAPGMFSNGYERQFDALQSAFWVTSFGGDAYAYGLLASGHLELIVERGLHRHDVAALIPVVTGAGGSFTDLKGIPVTNINPHTDDIQYDCCVTASQDVLDGVLPLLQQQ